MATKRDKLNIGTKEHSTFYVPPLNESGVEERKSKSLMRRFAIQKPVDYLELRDEVHDKCISKFADVIYDTCWDLFSEGLYTDPENLKAGQKQIHLKGMKTNGGASNVGVVNGNGVDWRPRWPGSKINQVSTQIAMSLYDKFDEFFSELMPESFDSISNFKMGEAARNQQITDVATQL